MNEPGARSGAGLLAYMRDTLANEHEGLADLPLEAFAACSLRRVGLDSLDIVALLANVQDEFGWEPSVALLQSPELDTPASWVRDFVGEPEVDQS